MTVEKYKAEIQKQLADLNQQLDTALQMRRDSSARRLETTEQKNKEVSQLKETMQ